MKNGLSLKVLSPYLFFLALLSLISCQEAGPKADLILTNANIWTGSESQPSAQAIAVLADTILAIGSNGELEKYKGHTTEIINVHNRFITPGFIDSHVHLLMGGNSLLNVELRDAQTPEEFTRRIADFANTLEPGTWIMEGNWDHTLWGGELPQKEWIDPYTKNNPVAVYRLDGHMVFANSAALDFAGIDKDTPDVPNGEIVRDDNGIPTGILKSNAMGLLLDKIPPLTKTQKKKALKEASRYFLSHGVTSVHDVDSLGTAEVAQELLDAKELSLRIYSAKPLNRWKEAQRKISTDELWLKTGIVKGFIDGSLGSHTASFMEPYTDKPADSGLLINSEANLYQWISEADKAGLHIQVHAIGDNAIHTLLEIYERIVRENGEKERRLRIEHAQHISKQDLHRFGELGIIASVQPYHAIDDGRWAEALIGPERIKTTYAFQSLLEANTILAFGSDWPVAPGDPLTGIYAAVTRNTLDGKNPNGWVPEQKISLEEALRAYTKNGAYASFDETVKGTLEPGKLADFVILSEDIQKIDPKKIREVKVMATYLGGKLVYENDQTEN
ncbi:amidohydrolase [Zobellia uliginosa]|uniref:amidohydrolase n=1 Tax=Zobellia uliginosa TaxID=143224 RepID=UPI0026E28196|nr:amidohydrolase [Zobellia uliginosa]MDO6517713.1 amidohydrolase [Zobellia uliginosa]